MEPDRPCPRTTHVGPHTSIAHSEYFAMSDCIPLNSAYGWIHHVLHTIVVCKIGNVTMHGYCLFDGLYAVMSHEVCTGWNEYMREANND